MKKSLLIAALFLICAHLKISAQDGMYRSFGAEITAESAASLADLEKGLASSDSIETKVMGKIDDICQVKGCWMNVSDQGDADHAIFVRFKDYGFFVPKDAGKEVVMEGVAYKELTSVEELRHYAKDSGLSEDEISKITEPKEEIRFLAKGVLIKN